MSDRIYWRRAHPVRIPDRVNTQPHLELRQALRFDIAFEELGYLIAVELERELQREGE